MLLDNTAFLVENRRNKSNLKILKSSLETGNVSHAYFFNGSNMELLDRLAFFFAASINCELKGCGNCRICENTIKGLYPNLIVIEPDGNVLTIDKIIQLQKFMGITSYSKGKKVCIIKEAELMNREASNRLLKTLEDPPDSESIFILLSEDLQAVLPTIVSRCIVFEWDFLQTDDIDLNMDVKTLQEIVDKGIKEIINSLSFFKYNSGNAGNKKTPENLNVSLKLSLEILDFLKNKLSSGDEEIKTDTQKFKSTGASAAELKKIEEGLRAKNRRKQNKYYNLGINRVFDIITAWLEDILSVKSGADLTVLNYSLNYEIIVKNVKFVKIEKIFKLLEIIENNRNYLKYSIYPELALDNIFLQMQNLN
jgi:DNA polymerase-3 subunit delta'